MTQTRKSRRYVLVYFITLGIFAALCVGAYVSQKSYRKNPVDFLAMPDDSYVPTYSLTRLQREEIKLGFVERAPPPVVGLFGNHQVAFMARRNFGPDVKRGYFFNYSYANLGLPELYDYMSYLADKDKLPSDLMIVQITTPNNDGGAHILTYMHELSPDLVHYASNRNELTPWLGYGNQLENREVIVRENLFNPWINRYPWLAQYYETLPAPRRMMFLNIEHYVQMTAHYAHQALNYATLGALLGSILRGGTESRVIDGNACSPAASDFVTSVISRGATCTKADLHMALRNDGSFNADYYRGKPLKQNETPAYPVSRFIRDGDEVTIAAFMERIEKIARDRGRKLVFLIPPVYETPREGGADKIMTRALALVPHIPVVDDRHAVRDEKYFVDYDHPSPLYFDRLVAILRERGFLPAAP